MDLNFFKQIRILDGGMGQELLARGMKPKGTLWSAAALLNKLENQMIIDTHLDFINSGAEVIVTNTFATRKQRLKDHNIEDKFNLINSRAGELAQKAKIQSGKKILIAGGLPPQNETYKADTRNFTTITKNFYDQAKILNPFIDFFYFDVLSSGIEIEAAINAIKSFNKPFLIGLHISDGTKTPSKENISKIFAKIDKCNLLGIILACVSPENFKINLEELKNLKIPFGFKINGFKTTVPKINYTKVYKDCKSGNPNELLGKREDLTPEKFFEYAKEFKDAGATILGGCCETNPSYIKKISQLK